MRIGVAGPIDVTAFQGWMLEGSQLKTGYSFPLTSHLALEYRRAGHHVCVFAEDQEAATIEHHRGDGVDVWVVPMRPRPRSRALDAWRQERRALSDAMRESACDVIHAHWTYEFALAALAVKTPTLVTVHDWAPGVFAQHRDAYRLIRLGMQLRVLWAAPHLTAVSPYIAQHVSRIARSQVLTIPNGIDDSWIVADRRAFGPPHVISAVNAGFEPRKNVTVLLAAFAKLWRRQPDLELRLFGGDFGPDGPAVEWARARGLERGVSFIGPVSQEDLRTHLAQTTLFVHPSLEESFGMVVLEAAAAGVPILAHREALGPAWILRSFPDQLIDCRDPGAMASAMQAVLESEPHPERVAQLQREVMERFSLERVSSLYLTELEALGRGGSERGSIPAR